jgi:antitoxin YefM
MNITTVSNFRKDAKKYFDQVIEDQDVLVITRSDGKTTVMMTLEQYNSTAETEYLMRSPANAEHLRKSVADAQAGKTSAHDLIEP